MSERLAYLLRSLKTPRIAERLPATAERARAEQWPYDDVDAQTIVELLSAESADCRPIANRIQARAEIRQIAAAAALADDRWVRYRICYMIGHRRDRHRRQRGSAVPRRYNPSGQAARSPRHLTDPVLARSLARLGARPRSVQWSPPP